MEKPQKQKTKKQNAAGQKKRLDIETKFAAAYTVKPNAYKAGLAAGLPESVARAQSYDLVNNENVQSMLKGYRKDFSKDCKADFKWKVNKLIACVEKAIPDDFEHKNSKLIGVAIKAIAELNKMQGDYAPIKTYNENFTREMSIEVKSLVITYEKEY